MTKSDKLSTIIIDDELHARELLKTLLERYCPKIEVIGEADSVDQGLDLINTLNLDLIFLDIKLKKRSGFEILEALEGHSFQVIFTTAYSQFAIKAFEYAAVHYLLKPINVIQLEEAVHRVGLKNDSFRTSEFLNYVNNFRQFEYEKLALPNRLGEEFVFIKDIICCIASGAYTKILLRNNQESLISKPLGYFERILNTSVFCRTHRKYLVNMLEVKSIIRGKTATLVLSDAIKVDVSTTYKNEVLRRLSSGFMP